MEPDENKSIELYLQTIAQQMSNLTATFSRLNQSADISTWVTLEEAAKMKGGVCYAQLQKKKWLMPCCGTNYKYFGGKRVWHKDLVWEWVFVTDDVLEDYAAKYNVDISKWFKNGKAVGKGDE